MWTVYALVAGLIDYGQSKQLSWIVYVLVKGLIDYG